MIAIFTKLLQLKVALCIYIYIYLIHQQLVETETRAGCLQSGGRGCCETRSVAEVLIRFQQFLVSTTGSKQEAEQI